MADSAPSRPKRFWPMYLVSRNRLEGLGGVELGQDMAVLFRLEIGRHALDVLLDPALLRRLHDVHVLDADRPAICVPQDRKDVAEPHLLRLPAKPWVRNSRSRSHTVSP